MSQPSKFTILAHLPKRSSGPAFQVSGLHHFARREDQHQQWIGESGAGPSDVRDVAPTAVDSWNDSWKGMQHIYENHWKSMGDMAWYGYDMIFLSYIYIYSRIHFFSGDIIQDIIQRSPSGIEAAIGWHDRPISSVLMSKISETRFEMRWWIQL